jgi:hypothetical protein
VTLQKEFWIPDPDIMEDDQREWQAGVDYRREAFLKDHHECGAIWSLWISETRYVEQIPHGIQQWVDDNRGLTSYESWGCTVLISFHTKETALLFKLMFGGE